jgi:hypothetical protein
MMQDLQNHYSEFQADIVGHWAIDFCDLNNASYDLDIENARIIIHNFGLSAQHLLSSKYFRPQVALAMAEAYRMVRHVEWLDGMLTRYNPETIILIGRICVADTVTQTIKFAFDAKTNKDDVLWKHILCGENADMAMAFINGLEKFLTAGMDYNVAEKKACAVAFNTWFACSTRMDLCDHDTLTLMDDMIENNEIFDLKKMEKNAVTCLTLMPGCQTSYIDTHLQNDILKNPYYIAMNNTANQTHLAQITRDINTVNVAGIVFRDHALAQRFALVDHA